MKHLIKKFVKLLYVVIVPILAIICCALYFRDGSGYMPVTVIIVLIALLSIVNAMFFTVFMDKVILLPKITTQFGIMIALGFAWQDRSLMIFVPFCAIEFEWRK